jgi:ubiquinone/menaquinone biosynthesis C-methylase UbiE
MKTLEDVQQFWESNPLWSGESQFNPGTLEFYEEHRQVVVDDCLAGSFDERVIPSPQNCQQVLDLGCGPGFWTVELYQRGCKNIVAADLTENALILARQRCSLYQIPATFSQQNAENLTFPDETFTHVNCQGVIHHTPKTEQCIAEIARILKTKGTASISVYYKNAILSAWPLLRPIGRCLAQLGAGLKGRGREAIYTLEDVNEIVRLYDGAANPIGKAYSKKQFHEMLSPYFVVEETYLHFFPARTLPFPLPRWAHRWLDANLGFMIYATVRKRA